MSKACVPGTLRDRQRAYPYQRRNRLIVEYWSAVLHSFTTRDVGFLFRSALLKPYSICAVRTCRGVDPFLICAMHM